MILCRRARFFWGVVNAPSSTSNTRGNGSLFSRAPGPGSRDTGTFGVANCSDFSADIELDIDSDLDRLLHGEASASRAEIFERPAFTKLDISLYHHTRPNTRLLRCHPLTPF
mmetsp:Transcript_129411/g.182448  ORF Transcript_129411/g.182448 Transcript_129411/m.182448 type:complete len:112 (-) Transcript_129411:1289-1624(-)